MDKYHELLKKLYAVNVNNGMKLGLENIYKLDALMNFPSKKFPAIHIAGTNGKGSVTAKIGKGLESSNTKVGVFTSPHISTFRERIAINGELIEEEYIVNILPKIFELAERHQITATFFEITTLLALTYFAENGVDIAVIETGLGGRLDATNIVNSILCIITSIDFDHTELLGFTLESIAREKGGITKSGVPVILGPTAHIVPVKEGCPILFIQDDFENVEDENRAIARKALEHFEIPEPTIRKALTTRPPCRREKIYFQGREVILDVSHNPRGLFCLFKELNIPQGQLRVVFGISKNKDLEACLKIVQNAAADIHLVEASNGRSATTEFLKQLLLKQGVSENRITLHRNISDSLKTALALSEKSNQQLVVCGTFFIMSEVRLHLGIDEPRDPMDMNETHAPSLKATENVRLENRPISKQL